MKKIEAYKKILDVVDECMARVRLDDCYDLSGRLKELIQRETLASEFGIKIDGRGSNGWYEVSMYEFLGLYGVRHGRSISWPDCGNQPDDEWLYSIQFSTGAYIFDQEYPTQTFNAFFSELKTFGPKYLDSANHALYFTSENSSAVHAAFGDVLNKYAAKVKDELRAKKIGQLKAELANLGAN